MVTPVKNLYVDQGSSFTETINVVDSQGLNLDLNNYNIIAQIKKNYSSSTSTNFEIIITSNSQFKLYLDATSSATLTSGKYVYDVIIADDTGNVQRIQEGNVIVSPGVSTWQQQ